MKGNNTLEINQATMIEAMQQYIDLQMNPAPLVISVTAKSNTYGGATDFVLALGEKEAEGKA